MFLICRHSYSLSQKCHHKGFNHETLASLRTMFSEVCEKFKATYLNVLFNDEKPRETFITLRVMRLTSSPASMQESYGASDKFEN